MKQDRPTADRKSLQTLALRVLARNLAGAPDGTNGRTRVERRVPLTPEQEDQMERRRNAAVADSWERLRDVYACAGRPEGWLTAAVRAAEVRVETAWLAARQDPLAETIFRSALDTWLVVAQASIAAAAEQGTKSTRLIASLGGRRR